MLLHLFPHTCFCSFVPFDFNNYVHMLHVFQQQKQHSLDVTGYNKIFCHSNMWRRLVQWNFNNFHWISAKHLYVDWIFSIQKEFRLVSMLLVLRVVVCWTFFVHFTFRSKSTPNWHLHRRMWKWFVPFHCRIVCASLRLTWACNICFHH